MNTHPEKATPFFISVGFGIYLVGGILGGLVFDDKSVGQLVSWQIGNTGAICASVLAAALLSKYDWHFPSAGFIILGIVHGIDFSSLTMDTINENIFVTSALVIVPSIFLINYYKLFPMWVRISGWITCCLFLWSYIRMLNGTFVYGDLSQSLSYFTEQATMVGWCITFLKKGEVSSQQN